ncbi:MAG: hypothetical protein M3P22_00775 [bacterium]|nr:hypothetical protein [bacterium]
MDGLGGHDDDHVFDNPIGLLGDSLESFFDILPRRTLPIHYTPIKNTGKLISKYMWIT